MNLTKTATDTYNFLVGTTSKAAYLGGYAAGFIAIATAKTGISALILSLPVNLLKTHFKKDSIEVKPLRLNINLDNCKIVAGSVIIANEIFNPKSPSIHKDACYIAKALEIHTEDILCISGKLCSGDQYGLFDYIHDYIV